MILSNFVIRKLKILLKIDGERFLLMDIRYNLAHKLFYNNINVLEHCKYTNHIKMSFFQNLSKQFNDET